jgi:hypothetical protein
MKTYICRGCSVEHPRRGVQFKNFYCSNKCQKDYESKERVRQWLEEGKDWLGQVPKWVKRALAELHGNYCSVCKINEYNNLPIMLECDHIDGNHTNNNIINLRLICPNCHSQTNTYKARNKGNGRSIRRKAV